MSKAPGFCPCSDHPHVWNATWCYLYERPIYCPHADGECPNRKPNPIPQRCLNCGARRDEDCQTWCAYKPAGRFVPVGTGWPVQ